MSLSSLPLSFDSLQTQFGVMKQCPLCNTTFETSGIKTIENQAKAHVFHITCSSCKHALVVLLGMTDIGVGLVGLLSDLTYEDMNRMRGKSALSEDDLFGLYHIILEKNKFNQYILSKI
ncbi:MAG: hypothetical protein WCW16_01560 [Candidatus Magasanikbacteria bacterium]